jgi:hypothetical protein
MPAISIQDGTHLLQDWRKEFIPRLIPHNPADLPEIG